MRRWMGWIVLAAAWPMAAQAGPATDNPLATGTDRAVDAAVQTFFQDDCHVGLSLVVRRGGEERFYDYGSTQRDGGDLPTRDTLREIGSLTKTVVGTLTAQAVVEGRMALDGPISGYLGREALTYDGRAVQVRDIVTHTSALPAQVPDVSDIPAEPAGTARVLKLMEREAPYGDAQYRAALDDWTLTRRPGERFEYSNYAPKMLGLALERVEGAPLATLFEQRLAGPLGMASTGFAVPEARWGRLAVGYDGARERQPYYLPNTGAAGGLYSSASDMARYLAFHMEEGPAARLTHQPLLHLIDDLHMAMFWMVQDPDGPATHVWQSGGMYGMSSQMAFWPKEGFGAVTLANDACPDTQGQLLTIITSVRDALEG